MIPIARPTDEYLPLPMAAALAYIRLVSHDEREPSSLALLDVVASALSVWIPIYGGEPRTRLDEAHVSRGKFCNGATLLRFRDGPPVENLAILHRDLQAGVRRLELAGVRFSEAMAGRVLRPVPGITRV